ncbi:hypothetical protein D3C72_2309270 [compost metagenome]
MHQADTGAQALALAGRQLPGVFAQHLQLTAARAQSGGQQIEQARLACARRADDSYLFARTDVQVHATQRLDAVGVGQGDPGQLHGHLSKSAARAASSMPL